jgi:hypothetical protein
LEETVKNNGFEFEGQRTSYNERELSSVVGMIQVDIISKIMMYIEDLVILMEGLRVCNGNYYKLLDMKAEEDIDLGSRISRFFETQDKFTFDEWRKILSYINPKELSSKDPIVTRLIELNIEAFKEFIGYIKLFNKTHRQIFRRYKHAGFPFVPGYKSQQPYPFTTRIFDSYTMVFTGPNPLVDLIPLPYSHDILESYRISLPTLQTRIMDIVQNKIQCIKKRVRGIIPTKAYAAHLLTEDEQSRIVSEISKFDVEYPDRTHNDVYNFEMNKDYVREMKWYIDLDENMAKWKSLIRQN